MIGQLKLALTRRVACGAVAMGKGKAQCKLYAVRAGRRTGIFHSWDDCSRQVNLSAALAASCCARDCDSVLQRCMQVVCNALNLCCAGARLSWGAVQGLWHAGAGAGVP